MLRLVAFLVIAAAVAWGAVWIADHPGTIEVRWLGQELILSTGAALVLALLAAVAVVLVFEILRWLIGLPRRWRISRARQHELRGYQTLTRGLLAVAAGDLAGARSNAREAERYVPGNAGVMLLNAQAAQLEGREEVAHLKFRQMLDRRDGEFVGLRGLLVQAMKTGDHDEALHLARRAYRRSPTTPWVLTTLYDLLTRAERWDEALALVGELHSQRLIDEPQARYRRGVLHHLLAERLQRADRLDESLAQARKGVKAAPGFAPGAVLASELAMQGNRRRLALQVLEESWRANPHPETGRAFAGLDPSETPAQRLQRVDTRLGPLRRDHPELLVLQAETAMQAEQWDVARSRLEAALASEPTARVYRLLAELERHAGDPGRAQEWLAKAADAPADKAWVCDDTGETLRAWQPFGPGGGFDTVHWSTPARVATMIGNTGSGTTYILPKEDAQPREDDLETVPKPQQTSSDAPARAAVAS